MAYYAHDQQTDFTDYSQTPKTETFSLPKRLDPGMIFTSEFHGVMPFEFPFQPKLPAVCLSGSEKQPDAGQYEKRGNHDG